MGKIIKNGISYGGTSSSADRISFDDTVGLNAVSVQDAIVSVNTKANDIKDTLSTVQSLHSCSSTTDDTLESAISKWCDENKPNSGEITNINGQFKSSNGVFSIQATRLDSNGVLRGGVAQTNAGRDIYSVYRLAGQNAVATRFVREDELTAKGAIYHANNSSTVALSGTITNICNLSIPSNGRYLLTASLNYQANIKRIDIIYISESGTETVIVYKLVPETELMSDATLIKAVAIEKGTLQLRATGNGNINVDARINFLQAIKL